MEYVYYEQNEYMIGVISIYQNPISPLYAR